MKLRGWALDFLSIVIHLNQNGSVLWKRYLSLLELELQNVRPKLTAFPRQGTTLLLEDLLPGPSLPPLTPTNSAVLLLVLNRGAAVLMHICPPLSSTLAQILSPVCGFRASASSSVFIWTSMLCGIPSELSKICSVFCLGEEGAERAVGDQCTPAND